MPGLRNAIRKYQLARIPILGALLRLFFKVESNSLSATRMRALQQEIYRLDRNSAAHFGKTDRVLDSLQTLIAQQRQQLSQIEVALEKLQSDKDAGVFSATLAGVNQWRLGRRTGE